MCLIGVLKDENQVKGSKILGYHRDCSRNASDAGQDREMGDADMLPEVGEVLLAVYKHRRKPVSSVHYRPVTDISLLKHVEGKLEGRIEVTG